jgi:hypothetical protein
MITPRWRYVRQTFRTPTSVLAGENCGNLLRGGLLPADLSKVVFRRPGNATLVIGLSNIRALQCSLSGRVLGEIS